MTRRVLHTLVSLVALLASTSCGPSGARTTTPPHGSGDQSAQDLDAILAASDLPPLLAAPIDGDPMAVTVHRLQNGLTVYISTDRSTPRISAWTAIRAGSRHDPANSTGLAHYLEHMLFKGSGKLGTRDFASEKVHIDRIAQLYNQLREAQDDAARQKILDEIDAETQKSAAYSIPNEIDNLYAGLGISGVNAFTSDEQTVYIADIPANRFESWATVEGDRFLNPQFRLFYPELESVYEEKNRTMDSPFWRVIETAALSLFPKHPYGTQPTIGLVDHLKTPAYADMAAYFERWYVPNNMAILLAGDIDAATALPVLERAFASLTPRELESPIAYPIEPLTGRVEHQVVAEGEEAVFLAWHTVPYGHADRPAVEVMDLVMDNATTGLLNTELVLQQKLPKANSYGDFLNEAGHWMVTGTARQGQSLEEVEQLLLETVAKLKSGEFSSEDLAAIILNAEISKKRGLESNDARVSAMAEAYVAHDDWRHAAFDLDRLRKVTRDDVIRVANTYLTDNVVVIKRINGEFQPPKIDKPKITPVKIDPSRESEFAGQVKAMPITEIEPSWLEEGNHFTRGKLPAGPLVSVTNDRNDLFAIDYRFDVGYRQMPLLCHALDLLELSGSGDLTAVQLRRKLYALGTEVSFSCGADTTTVKLSGIDRNMDASVEQFKGWLASPALDKKTADKLVTNTISKRTDEMREPASISQALDSFAAQAKQSPYLASPSNARLKSASLGALKSLIVKLPNLQHRTAYFGPRSPEAVAPVIAIGKSHKPVAKPVARRYREVAKPTIYFLNKKVAQAQINITFAGDTPTTERARADRVASTVYNYYVGGGMGALIFQEIREARGLAYSAWGYHSLLGRTGDQSGLMAGIGTQADKTVEALTTMLSLLVELDADAKRLATARDGIAEGFRTDRTVPRNVARSVFQWNDVGEDHDLRRDVWEGLSAVSEAELTAFGKRVAGSAPVIAIMGDRERIDLSALAKIGRVQEVTVEQIFAY